MPKKCHPKYRRHASKDQGVADVYRHDGTRVRIYFPGKFESAESLTAYGQMLASLAANGGRLPATKAASHDDTTINELILAYLEQRVTPYYRRPDGTPKLEARAVKVCLRPMTRMFGTMLVRDFDAASLEAYRNALINGTWFTPEERERYRRNNKPTTQSRRTVNRNIGRVLMMFKWGVVRRLVPAIVVESLRCLEPLRTGDPTVRSPRVIDAVDPAIVESCLPYLPPHVQGIVRILMLTGARIGEIVMMRNGDIDRDGAVWRYVPRQHKNLHRGHVREIHFGPKAQLVLRQFITDDVDAFTFSPKVQYAILTEAKRAKRKSPVQPSQLDRSKISPARKPGEHFTHHAVNRAIRRAARKADVPAFHCHQLRHLAAQEITKQFGVEAARATLGHQSINTTTIYAAADAKHAAEVAARVG